MGGPLRKVAWPAPGTGAGTAEGLELTLRFRSRGCVCGTVSRSLGRGGALGACAEGNEAEGRRRGKAVALRRLGFV